MKTNRLKQDAVTFANTTRTFDAFDVTNFSGFSYAILISGASLAGTIKLQCSNDGTNWADIASVTAAIPASGGLTVFNVPDTFYCFARLHAVSSDADVVTLSYIALAKSL